MARVRKPAGTKKTGKPGALPGAGGGRQGKLPGGASDLELQVLSLLWSDGPATAREVLTAMPDGKQRSYTTILSVMQVMEKKGLLTHTSRGRAHVYKPAVTQKQVLRPMLRGMVTKVFGGSTAAAVQQLLDANHIDDGELSQIRQLLNDQSETDAGKGD